MQSGRKLPGRLAIVTLMAALTMVSSQRAQRAPAPAPPNFDIRTAKEVDAVNFIARNAAPAAAAAFATQRAVGAGQVQSLAGAVDVIDAPEMAVPEIVSARPGTGFLTAATTNRAGAMRAFLTSNSSFYGLSTDQVASLELVADYTNPAGNMSWVEFEQRINGLPVFRGLIRGGFTSRGELARTTGQLAAALDEASLATAPSLSAAEAVSAAGGNVGWNVSTNGLGQATLDRGRLTLARGSTPMADDARAWQMYFPLAPGVARLAWATEIWGDPDAYLIIVDALDGTVLFRKNLTEYQTQAATYRIYADDSPAPMSPSTVLPGGAPAPFIPRVLVSLIGNEGVNAFNDLGWMTDGLNATEGNNVIAGIDRDGTNGVDATITGVSRTFDFNFNPATDDPLTANYQAGEVTDTFYWTNVYHDRLYLLGFTEAARNFQNNNFGRGGLGNDRISAESQDSSGVNNANFSTPSDGSPGRMQMFIFTGPNPDRGSGLDHDVLFHELTHGLSNRLHQFGSGSSLSAAISRGLGEGWSDFYARALLSTAAEDPNAVYNTGAFVTNNYYAGIRRFPYAVMSNVGPNGKPHNPLTLADIDNTQINTTDGAFPIGATSDAFEVHRVGEIWAMTLLEVRARFITRLGFDPGNQRFLQFATDGMKLDPANPTPLQARDSIVLAATNGGGTAADIADIWAGFATRGMGRSAQILNVNTGLVVEAFDLPGIAPNGSSLVSEAFPNFQLDPAELVTASLCVTNNSGATSGSVTGTLLATGGVTSPSGAQSYGAVAAGATVCRNFTFTVGATCGSRVTATLQITESGAAGRSISYSMQVGSLAPFFSENFDGVTAPALPAGWSTSTLAGTATLWATNTSSPDTAPNRMFASQPTTVSDNVLVSSPIVVPAGVSQLTFRNNYNTETFADGGVLEISIDGGPFVDILAAGGSFVSGGYSGKVSTLSDSPLAGRLVWTNTSNLAYVTTGVALPVAAVGKSVMFRWRSATDTGTALTGWSIDTISLASFACSNESPGIVVQPPSQTIATGDNGRLPVFATGSPTLSYQWYQGNSPNTASPIAGATSSLFVTPPLTATTSYWVRVSNGLGVLDSNTATVTVSNTITASAAFDSSLKVPRCATPGGVCDSGPMLLNGRANISGGPEPNQPNTLASSPCADGASGVYHSDESIDRVKVSTLDGSPMAAGKTVRVDVTAWIFSATDRLDVYFAPTTVIPTWTLAGTVSPTSLGAQTMSVTYTLPAGPRQVVRANLRDGGIPTTCSLGTFDDHDDLAFAVGPTASAELMTNGNFSAGTTGWSLWEVPNIVSSVTNGVFQFFQDTPGVGSGQATIFQNTGQPVIAGAPLLATFQLGNSSAVRKRISVLVLEHDFSDLAVCTFWLPPNQTTLKTYTMRTHTTRNWSNASIYFYSATPGSNGGNYLLDEVSLKYVPGQANDRTLCEDPNVPPTTAGVSSGNLLQNGDFSSGSLLPGWSAVAPITTQITSGVLQFLRPNNVTPAGNIMQETTVNAVTDQLFTATFALGNSSPVRKRVTVLVHDLNLASDPDLVACTFMVPPGMALSNYTVRGRATKDWANATISFYPATVGLEQWILLDDVTLAKSAPTAMIGTECIEPATIPFPPGSAGGGGSSSQAGRSSLASPARASTQPGAPLVRRSDGPRRVDDRPYTDVGDGWTVDASVTRHDVLRWADPIDLTRATGGTLSFWSLLSARTSSAEIQVSLDGVTWETLAYVPPTPRWTLLDFDLDAYAGGAIYIQFVFDAVVPDAGIAPDTWRFRETVVTTRGGK